ncbi:uncharacterized protein [Diabrotica undecimpunctata]|uniref:uncharacterized protein n=1 Tax=Diabrotica undecimpunctata TaxID=50387 RepID=UPI003B63A5CF
MFSGVLFKKVEGEHRRNQNKNFYREVRQHKRGSYISTSNFVRDKNGEMLAAENKIIERWAEYFEDLLNIQNFTDENNDNGGNNGEHEYQMVELEIPPPSMEEITHAIKTLKNNKSPGLDNIDAELIKTGGHGLISNIQQLIEMAWQQEIFPKDWCGSIIVPIHKKGKK